MAYNQFQGHNTAVFNTMHN